MARFLLYILVKENLIITNRKVMEDFMNELSLFNTLFNSAFDGTMPEFNIHASPAMPKVDVMEMKDNYLLEMELPGLTEKDVNIELDRNVLTIASVKADKTEKAENSEKSENHILILTKDGRVCKTFYIARRCRCTGNFCCIQKWNSVCKHCS